MRCGGETIIDSVKLAFPINVDEFSIHQEVELVGALKRVYPSMSIERV